MNIAEQVERLAAALGADAVHLVHLRQSGRWFVIALWGEDETARFRAADTAEGAIGEAELGASEVMR